MDKREIWHSSVSSQLLTLTLKRGGWLAALGALLLLSSAIFLPLVVLKGFGIPIFLTGLLFITLGWLPYQKLLQLQLKPHLIDLREQSLVFCRRGRPLFQIECLSIKKICYLHTETCQGIALWLKIPNPYQVKVLQSHFNYKSFIAWSKEREGCDLFFSHFTERTFVELQKAIGEIVQFYTDSAIDQLE